MDSPGWYTSCSPASDLSFVDEHIVLDACDELMLDRPSLDTKITGQRETKSLW